MQILSLSSLWWNDTANIYYGHRNLSKVNDTLQKTMIVPVKKKIPDWRVAFKESENIEKDVWRAIEVGQSAIKARACKVMNMNTPLSDNTTEKIN